MTPSMNGKKTCLKDRIRREVHKQNAEFYMELRCIIHQQYLSGKASKFEHVTKVVVSAVDFILSQGLNHCQFFYG